MWPGARRRSMMKWQLEVERTYGCYLALVQSVRSKMVASENFLTVFPLAQLLVFPVLK